MFENFIFKQADYSNKPLKVLLQQLEIPVAKYIPISGGFNIETGKGKLQNTGTYLHFYNYRVEHQKIRHKQEPSILFVTFKQPLSMDSLRLLLKKYYLKHNDSLQLYYENRVIDSIDYVHYHISNKVYRRSN